MDSVLPRAARLDAHATGRCFQPEQQLWVRRNSAARPCERSCCSPLPGGNAGLDADRVAGLRRPRQRGPSTIAPIGQSAALAWLFRMRPFGSVRVRVARSAQGSLARCRLRTSARLALSKSRMKRVSLSIVGRSKVCQSTESSRSRSSMTAKKAWVSVGSPRIPM